MLRVTCVFAPFARSRASGPKRESAKDRKPQDSDLLCSLSSTPIAGRRENDEAGERSRLADCSTLRDYEDPSYPSVRPPLATAAVRAFLQEVTAHTFRKLCTDLRLQRRQCALPPDKHASGTTQRHSLPLSVGGCFPSSGLSYDEPWKLATTINRRPRSISSLASLRRTTSPPLKAQYLNNLQV